MRKFATIALLTVTALAAGCGVFQTKGDGPLIADVKSPITDAPVPAGFEMATKNSTSKVVPGLRFVDHRYHGGDDFLPVVQFYKEQMPQRGWELGTQTQPSGKEIVLQFSNKARNEDCQVTVTKQTFGSEIRIKIDPVGRNAGQ